MTPGIPQLTPEQVQQFMQMMKMRQGGAGGAPQQTQPVQSQQSQGGAMPNPISPVATQPMAIAPNQPQQYGGSRAAGILNTVMQIKQQMHKSSIDKAAKMFAWGDKIKDPKEQQRLAEESKADPARAKLNAKMAKDLAKITDKANSDPRSAEFEGLQQFLTAKQQQEVQEQQRQIAQQQYEANEAQKRAMADYYSGRNPATLEVEKQKQEAQNKRMQMQVDARTKSQTERIASMKTLSDTRLAMMEKIAKMKEGGLNVRAGQRQQQSQASQALYREAAGIQNELNELERRKKDIADNREKHPVLNWFSDEGNEAQSIDATLDQQIQTIQSKQQVIYASFDAMQQVGVIPRAPQTATSGDVKVTKRFNPKTGKIEEIK